MKNGLDWMSNNARNQDGIFHDVRFNPAAVSLPLSNGRARPLDRQLLEDERGDAGGGGGRRIGMVTRSFQGLKCGGVADSLRYKKLNLEGTVHIAYRANIFVQ